MAGESTGQERTESATPRRLQQARERGQVAQSRELNTMLMLLLSAGALLFVGPGLIESMANMFRQNFHISREHIFDTATMLATFKHAMLDALFALSPFFLIVTVAAVAGPIILGGFNFSSESLGFKWEKLDPIKGIQRIFALRGLVELLKALAKFLVIAIVAITYLYNQIGDYLRLGEQPLDIALAHTVHLLIWAFISIASGMILIAAVDVPFQVWDYHQQLKMTFQEVRDESKETEGSPETRSRVRKMQREIAQRRMMSQVPKADVVVTNPEHYSVALKYDPDNMAAPIVVAMGADIIAMQIRTIAREHEVPIVQAPPLARALYHTTELDREIPASLYLAVAQILAYVFQLKRKPYWQTRKARRFDDLPIPEDMQFD